MDEPWLKWVSILVIGDPNQSYYIYNIWYMIYIHYMHNFIPEIFCRTLMTIIYPLNVTWTLLKNHWRERIQWILENSHGKITPLIHILKRQNARLWFLWRSMLFETCHIKASVDLFQRWRIAQKGGSFFCEIWIRGVIFPWEFSRIHWNKI